MGLLGPAAAVALWGDPRKRSANPLGPATAVADVAAGAAGAVAAAAAPWCHHSPFAPSPPHISPHHLAPPPHSSPHHLAPSTYAFVQQYGYGVERYGCAVWHGM